MTRCSAAVPRSRPHDDVRRRVGGDAVGERGAVRTPHRRTAPVFAGHAHRRAGFEIDRPHRRQPLRIAALDRGGAAVRRQRHLAECGRRRGNLRHALAAAIHPHQGTKRQVLARPIDQHRSRDRERGLAGRRVVHRVGDLDRITLQRSRRGIEGPGHQHPIAHVERGVRSPNTVPASQPRRRATTDRDRTGTIARSIRSRRPTGRAASRRRRR